MNYMMPLPGFVERGECIPLDDLIGNVANVPKKLVEVLLAIGQALALVVACSHERLLTLGAHKVLRAPVLPYN